MLDVHKCLQTLTQCTCLQWMLKFAKWKSFVSGWEMHLSSLSKVTCAVHLPWGPERLKTYNPLPPLPWGHPIPSGAHVVKVSKYQGKRTNLQTAAVWESNRHRAEAMIAKFAKVELQLTLSRGTYFSTFGNTTENHYFWSFAPHQNNLHTNFAAYLHWNLLVEKTYHATLSKYGQTSGLVEHKRLF